MATKTRTKTQPKKKPNNSPLSNPEKMFLFESDAEKREYFTATMGQILRLQKAPKVKNDEEAFERVANYFMDCARGGVRPIYEEVALCLGTTRESLWNWETGACQGPIQPSTVKAIKEALAAFDARLAIENKMNPVVYFFRAKNYYGMKDQSEYVLTPNMEQPDKRKLIEDAELLPED